MIEDSDGKVLRTVLYRSIRRATYSESKRPAGRGVVGAFAKLFSGTKHWLTLETASESLVLRLSRNYKDILPMFEMKSSKTVERVVGDAR